MRKQPSILKIGLGLALPTGALLILVALLAWWEGGLSAWSAFFAVVERALITLMGEYPDAPHSVGGRVVQLLLLVAGTLILGTIVGKVSSLFVTHALREGKPVKAFKDHIIICNWNAKAPCVIRQLLAADPRNRRDIVVLTSTDLSDRGELDDLEAITFVTADPSHHAVLASLNATKAKAVILLADEDSPGPDEKNALIALAVKHLEETPTTSLDIHVVAELTQSRLRRHLHEAGVDEIVMFEDYSSGILAQSALFHNMSVVYQRLLAYTEDSNEIYFIESDRYPSSFVGKSFPELCEKVSKSDTQAGNNPLLLLGVKRSDGEVLLNPRADRFDTLSQGDALIIMAFTAIDRIAEPSGH